jgi:hypothetical protein
MKLWQDIVLANEDVTIANSSRMRSQNLQTEASGEGKIEVGITWSESWRLLFDGDDKLGFMQMTTRWIRETSRSAVGIRPECPPLNVGFPFICYLNLRFDGTPIFCLPHCLFE